ncbi:MAG: hypothetical protein IJU26_03985 [Synergistaceae bacterium]|nr:hypothetical protein [Synergistaceae bacterium]
MTLDRFLRWVLFCAGIITAIFAAYMFYVNDTSKGAACLAACVGFLTFATRYSPEKQASSSRNDPQDDADLHNLAVLIADLATMSLQNIGRTIPPSTKEIADIEGRVNSFLDTMPVSESEREEIAEKFEAIKDRTRRNQGGRAIMRSSRL